MTIANTHSDHSAPTTPINGDHVVVPVELGHRRYDITIGRGVIQNADHLLKPILTGRQVVIIADEAVATPWLEQLETALNRITHCHHVITAGGESAKSFSRYSELMENILDHGITRQTVIVALGGGVIGDLAGFMAASLLRGLDYVQIPTTLLSQVDSSVGGKTGINARAGKNLVGAFHQPRAVLIDTDCLATLPDREMRAGYAEVVKYGLLGHADFFDWLEEHGEAVLKRQPDPLIEAIRRCCQAKADIVAADETESGVRALLNLGHTFAHAFEAEAGYDGRLLHGEAVAAGLGHAFALSRRLGFIDGQSCHRVARHLEAMGLAHWRNGLPADMGMADIHHLIQNMGKDKKAQSGQLVFVLVRAIGDAFVEKGVNPQDVAAVLSAANMDEALS